MLKSLPISAFPLALRCLLRYKLCIDSAWAQLRQVISGEVAVGKRSGWVFTLFCWARVAPYA